MIWLIGNRGMLGTELAGLLEETESPFVGSDYEVDILSPEALSAFAEGEKITYILNCAAYTAVDKAEDEPGRAYALNVEGPRNIAELAQKNNAALIHISTDYVFDGTAKTPYAEDAPSSPTGIYGKTKAEGEEAIRAILDRHIIIRTAWLYGKHGPNFVYTMLSLMKERDEIGVVADQIGSPTWAFDLANAILATVHAPKPQWGTYHYTNAGACSWHIFAQAIQKLALENEFLEKAIPIKALSTAEYPTKAKRPVYSVLSKEKIIQNYGLNIPDWEQALENFFNDTFMFVDDLKDMAVMGEYDMETANSMFKASRYLYVTYSCQQALEKTFKALLCLNGKPTRGHNLTELAQKSRTALGDSEKQLVKTLTEYYIKGRYPKDISRLIENINRSRAISILEETWKLYSRLRKHPIFSLL